MTFPKFDNINDLARNQTRCVKTGNMNCSTFQGSTDSRTVVRYSGDCESRLVSLFLESLREAQALRAKRRHFEFVLLPVVVACNDYNHDAMECLDFDHGHCHQVLQEQDDTMYIPTNGRTTDTKKMQLL
jgi:hypothetical protein